MSKSIYFAEGGFDCDRLIGNVAITNEIEGGFGGGGGECGEGGGGGGYTGGAVLDYSNDIPGGGGHSVYVSDSQLTRRQWNSFSTVVMAMWTLFLPIVTAVVHAWLMKWKTRLSASVLTTLP